MRGRASISWCVRLAVTAATLISLVRMPADEPTAAANQVLADNLAEIETTLHQIEVEVERRRQLFNAGSKVCNQYVEELTHEYRSTVAGLRLARKEGLQGKADSLVDKQKRLALYLWHLERIAPLVAEVDDEYDSLTRVIRKLKNDHREQLRDPVLAKRVDEVEEIVQEVEEVRLQRRLASDRGFYDVRSNEELRNTRPRSNRSARQGEQPRAGSLQSLRLPLRRMVRLEWVDEGLAWNHEHWEELFFPESLAVIADEVDQQLEKRGWKLSATAHRSFLPENVFRAREPSLLMLFQNLRHVAFKQSGGVGTSSVISGQSTQRFSTDKLNGSLTRHEKATTLLVRETGDRHPSLFVQEHDGRFSLTITTGDAGFNLSQSPGKANLLWFDRENLPATMLNSDSFVGIYAENPALIEEQIFPFLERYGIITPPTRYDPIVIDRVLKIVGAAQSDAAERFERLLQQADGSRFETRTRAMAELEANMEQFVPLIATMMEKRDFSLEVKTRLERVVQKYEDELAGLDSMILRLNLSQDRPYLTSLVERVDAGQRPLIEKQLQQ